MCNEIFGRLQQNNLDVCLRGYEDGRSVDFVKVRVSTTGIIGVTEVSFIQVTYLSGP